MIALLLVLLGTFGITAWFGLIAARSLEVNAKEDAMIRRVQLNGVKEVARQLEIVLSRYPKAEVEPFTNLFWGRIQQWREDNRTGDEA